MGNVEFGMRKAEGGRQKVDFGLKGGRRNLEVGSRKAEGGLKGHRMWWNKPNQLNQLNQLN